MIPGSLVAHHIFYATAGDLTTIEWYLITILQTEILNMVTVSGKFLEPCSGKTEHSRKGSSQIRQCSPHIPTRDATFRFYGISF